MQMEKSLLLWEGRLRDGSADQVQLLKGDHKETSPHPAFWSKLAVELF